MDSTTKNGPSNMELANKMRMLIGRANFGRDDYQDIAITAAQLARRTTNIVTRIQLHRTSRLCARAAGMPELDEKQFQQERAILISFHRNRDLPGAEKARDDTAAQEFESMAARVARFTPLLRDLVEEEVDKAAKTVVEAIIGVNSEPDEKYVSEQFKKVGVLGLFLNKGELPGDGLRQSL